MFGHLSCPTEAQMLAAVQHFVHTFNVPEHALTRAGHGYTLPVWHHFLRVWGAELLDMTSSTWTDLWQQPTLLDHPRLVKTAEWAPGCLRPTPRRGIQAMKALIT